LATPSILAQFSARFFREASTHRRNKKNTEITAFFVTSVKEYKLFPKKGFLPFFGRQVETAIGAGEPRNCRDRT
jgi:hypothetical protein